jgi:predicted dehydrogenase
MIAQWHHLPALAKLKDADLVAVCDKDEGLVSRLAAIYGIGAHYTDFTRMLASEELDVVHVCTPPDTHPDLSVEALQAGCHVLVEKPMALGIGEYDRIIDASIRSGKKVCEVHHMLFESVMLKAQRLARRGAIGELLGVDVRSMSRRDGELLLDGSHWAHRLPAGILTESLAHPVYLAAAFLGKVHPVAIHAGRSDDSASTPREVRIVLAGEKGVGGVSYSCSSPPKDKMIADIYGTKGNLRVDLWNSVLTRYGVGGAGRAGRALENLGQAFSTVSGSVSTSLDVASGRFHTGHHSLIGRFIESVRKNTEPPVSIEESRNVIEVLEKVAESL